MFPRRTFANPSASISSIGRPIVVALVSTRNLNDLPGKSSAPSVITVASTYVLPMTDFNVVVTRPCAHLATHPGLRLIAEARAAENV